MNEQHRDSNGEGAQPAQPPLPQQPPAPQPPGQAPAPQQPSQPAAPAPPPWPPAQPQIPQQPPAPQAQQPPFPQGAQGPQTPPPPGYGAPQAQPPGWPPGQPFSGQQPLGHQHPGLQPSGLQPPGQQPPKRGLPVGAWIGIGAGAFVLLAGLVIAAILVIGAVSSLNSNLVQEIREVPTSPSAPLEDDEPDIDLRDADLEALGLDDASDFSQGPYWNVPFEQGWDIEVFDVDGVNRFSHPASGCSLYTFQGFGDPSVTAADDRAASEATVPVALQIGLPWTAATADPTVETVGVQEVTSYNYEYVEMLRLKATYPTAEGDRERHMLIRTFMPDNVVLYAEIDCPAPVALSTSDGIFAKVGVSDF